MLHQTTKLCKVKETINKMKRPPTEWEKIFANNISEKGIISKAYKEFIQLNMRKIEPNFKYGQRTCTFIFSKEDIQMANTYMKRYSTSLIRKM